MALLAIVLGYFGLQAAGLVMVIAGVLHFYLMEIDQQIVLQVRPFALIGFPLSALAVANLVVLQMQ